MYITKIEQGKGKRYKVFGDDMFLFALYGKELKRYHISEYTDIDDEIVKDILKQVVLKRAKERALYLLERRPLTVQMLKDKLKENEYPKDIIEQVVMFLEKYHYLNDEDYLRMYVEAYSSKKSKKQISYDLMHKGIAREIIDDFFENTEYSERESCKRQMERYVRGKNLEDREVRQKVFRYLYGKGFSSILIQDLLDIMHKNI